MPIPSSRKLLASNSKTPKPKASKTTAESQIPALASWQALALRVLEVMGTLEAQHIQYIVRVNGIWYIVHYRSYKHGIWYVAVSSFFVGNRHLVKMLCRRMRLPKILLCQWRQDRKSTRSLSTVPLEPAQDQIPGGNRRHESSPCRWTTGHATPSTRPYTKTRSNRP